MWDIDKWIDMPIEERRALAKTLSAMQRADLAAELARARFFEIKELRKTMPKERSEERRALDEAIRARQAQWWDDTKELFDQ